jgi:hypothetical protein
LTSKAVGLLRQARPCRCARPARAAPGGRAGVPTRVVSSASSPRRRAVLVRSGGAPRCSPSGLSPSTGSPRRVSARAGLRPLASHRVLVSEHTSGCWRPGQIGADRRLDPVRQGMGRTDAIARGRCARGGGRPSWSTRSCVAVCNRSSRHRPNFRCAPSRRSPSGLRVRTIGTTKSPVVWVQGRPRSAWALSAVAVAAHVRSYSVRTAPCMVRIGY